MSRRWIGVFGLVVPVLVITAGCTGGSPPVGSRAATGVSSAPSDSVTRSRAPLRKVGDEISSVVIPGAPLSMGAGFGSLWVATGGDSVGTLMRIAPRAGKVIATITVGGFPVGIAAGFGSIWQANNSDGTLMRIDPATNKVIATLPVGPGPAQLAVAGGKVWVANSDSTLVSVDPATNKRAQVVGVGHGSQFRAVVAGGGSVWTSNGDGGGVSRVDPATGKVLTTISIPACCDGDLIFARGLLWVSSPGERQSMLYQIDPTTNRVVRHFDIGVEARGIGIAGGRLWVTHEDTGLVSWHALDTGKRLGKVTLGGFIGAPIVTDSTSIWVPAADMDAIVRLATD